LIILAYNLILNQNSMGTFARTPLDKVEAVIDLASTNKSLLKMLEVNPVDSLLEAGIRLSLDEIRVLNSIIKGTTTHASTKPEDRAAELKIKQLQKRWNSLK
jgi:hypothetical protein